MQGHYDFGDGRKKEDPNYMIFQLAQLQLPAAEVRGVVASRSSGAGGMVRAPDYEGIANR
jgi:nitrate/nitrite transport system substrate-binding protein